MQRGTAGTATERGYNSPWSRARLLFLQDNPLCAACEAEGRIVRAEVVDHRLPHGGDRELFWNRDNWQSLCKRCHDRKTALETGRGKNVRRDDRRGWV